MKRLILLALLILTVLVGNLLMVRKEDANKNKLNEALATITPAQVKDGVVLGCKVVAVQERPDYPGVLAGKSISQVRQLILNQPPGC